MTVPNNMDLVKGFISFPAPSYVSDEELKTLAVLAAQKPGPVLTNPFERSVMKQYSAPYPLYAYDDTSYVAAFSGHPIYVADEVQLRLTGIEYGSRLKKVQSRDCSVLKDISYVYEVHAHPFIAGYASCGVKFKKIADSRVSAVYSKIK